MNRCAILAISGLMLLAVGGCADSAGGDPRQSVIQFFGAMEKNDQGTLVRLLDLPSLMNNVSEDYAVQTDNPRVFSNPKEILDDLTNDGLTKTRWFSYQRIVNDAEVFGESATVEVTFVDKEASRAYLTKFGLHVINGKWRIYSFKTTDAPPPSES